MAINSNGLNYGFTANIILLSGLKHVTSQFQEIFSDLFLKCANMIALATSSVQLVYTPSSCSGSFFSHVKE